MKRFYQIPRITPIRYVHHIRHRQVFNFPDLSQLQDPTLARTAWIEVGGGRVLIGTHVGTIKHLSLSNVVYILNWR